MPDGDAILLPPPPLPGGQHTPETSGAVVAYVRGLMEECYDIRRDEDERVDANVNLHEGRLDEDSLVTPDGVAAVHVNRVRNVDIAHVQVQTEDTPRIKLTARSSGTPGRAYLDPRVDVGNVEAVPELQAGLALFRPEALAGSVRLNDGERAAVEKLIAAGVLEPGILIVVNDRVKAEAEQAVFDRLWEDSGVDFYLREGVFRKTIVGWQFLPYGFDDRTKTHTLFNASHLQVFLDCDCSDIRDAAHAAVLQLMDLRRAQAQWPQWRAELEKAKVRNVDDGTWGFRVPAIWQKTTYQRDMVAVIHCWIRNYAFDLSPAEVEASGQAAYLEETLRAAVLDEAGAEVVPAEKRRLWRVATEQAGVYGDEMAAPGAAVQPGQRPWPTRVGIREIIIVGETVVRDGPTEFGDIPLLHLVDGPMIGSPFGQGQPEALEPLQEALNASLTDVATHFKFYGAPSMVMLQEIAARMPKFKTDAYYAPHSKIWEVPEQAAARVGGDLSKLIQFVTPAPLPGELWRFIDLLLGLIQEEGQVQEAMEGKGKAHWSGDLVARLQEAARGLIAWKSLRLEDALKYLAELMLHSQRTRLTAEHCATLAAKWPLEVWRAIRADPAKLNVTVEIVSGSGQRRESQKNAALGLNRNGQGPLSDTTLLERFDEDPEVERNNKIHEAEERAKAAAALQPAPPPAPPAPLPAPGLVPGA